MYGSVPLLLATEYRDHCCKLSSVWGGDEFGCCCTPCPCCHVTMETREVQDVAQSDYLGGRQGRHLVNISPSTPTDTHSCPRPTPTLPTAWSHSSSGAGILPSGLRAGLWYLVSTAGSCWQQNLSMFTKLSDSPNRAVGCVALVKKQQLLVPPLPQLSATAIPRKSLPRQNLKT